jgi:4-hydroxybenzoate polyprenyltransferase
MFATALMAVGLALAAAVSLRSLAVAAALGAAILLYDAWAKGTAVGPLAMGSCRLLNVALGLSVAPLAPGLSWAAPALAGLYTAALTFLARDEVGGSPQRRGRTFVAFMALLGLALLGVLAPRPTAFVLGALPFALLVGALGFRLFAPLWRDAAAPRIGRAVGGGILLMPALDATLVAGAGHPLAAVPVLALAGPALLLRRRFAMT